MSAPTLDYERTLLQSGVSRLACADEVGRGALAGPVSIGIVVVTADSGAPPTGLKDSKLLSARAREALAPALRQWSVDWFVGHAEASEIDELGITAAMNLAGRRALERLVVPPDHILLDGNLDYLSATLLTDGVDVPVTTRVKADLDCAGVAAASVLAKTTRDAIMAELAAADPRFGWERNKGYGAPEHLAALRQCGPSRHHRVSWRLPARDDLTSMGSADVEPDAADRGGAR